MNHNHFKLKRIISAKERDMLLRDYLRQELMFSNRLIKRIKSKKDNLLINGEAKTVRYQLKSGDVVEINFPPEEKSESIIPEKMTLNILYEDEFLLVIEKEAGIPTIPSRLHPT